MKERVTTLEQLMDRLEMIYEKQEETQRQVQRQGQKADLAFSEQQKQFDALLENNDAIKTQMDVITTDIENKFDAMQTYNEEKFGAYELLKQRHEELLREHMKKEEELQALQSQLESLESNPQAHSDDRFTSLQKQFIGLKEKNEERVVRLKNLNVEIRTFLKKFADTFCVPNPQHLSEIEEHFQSVQDRMQKLKSDNDSLMNKLQKLIEENENLIVKNRKLEEEITYVDKKKSKIEENLKNTKDYKNDKCLRLKGKKCH
jgi:chromosome segregation ATPase